MLDASAPATRPDGTPTPATRLTTVWAPRLALANLVVQVGIVVTGGLVRLTGSGLGCPTWPECVPGSYTPVVEQAEGVHKYIEFGNRTLTGVVGIAALAVLVAGVLLARRHGRSRGLVTLSALPLVGVVVQAVLGGITVLTSLHPATVAAHFLVSMLLVAVSTQLLDRVREGDASPQPVVRSEAVWLARALTAVLAVVLVLGTLVTGAGPHSGDADEPARLALDPRSISWLHADAVLLFVGLVVGLVVLLRATSAPDLARRRTTQLLVVTLAQAAVGYVQYLTDLPWVLVAVHMLGASLLVVAVVRVLSALRVRGPALPRP